MGDEGIEQPPLATPKTPISQNLPEKRTESGTPKDQKTPLDPDLALIQNLWPNLPEDIKAALLALVQAHGGR